LFFRKRYFNFRREFTLEELSSFDGKNKKAYISIKGYIFDVTNNFSFQENQVPFF
jgi:predicted heme/steroid binding protein